MQPSLTVEIDRWQGGQLAGTSQPDWVAAEEPLEIRAEGRSLAVVMRTPGHDEDLAAGFLLSEGAIKSAADIFELSICPSQSEGKGNAVDALLAGQSIDWASLTRHVFTSSSCGICGKASIDSVFQSFAPVESNASISATTILGLPQKLRELQETFSQTGGLHASALFDLEGNLLVLREDVGRHNALDKVIGHALRQNWLPLSQHVLMVSGRVSFEIVQKALSAGIPIIAAVSAPSSLAVQFAKEANQTLIGFLRGDRMNVYAHPERIL